MAEVKETDKGQVGPENIRVYRSGDDFVKAMADQLTVPDSFFDVHKSLERTSDNKDLKDPVDWVKALVPKEDAQTLNANLDSLNLYLHFSSKGEMPGNISENSTSGNYIKYLLAEAKLKAVQKSMSEAPERFADGLSSLSKAIKETQNLRKAVVQSKSIKFSPSNLRVGSAAGRVRIGQAIGMAAPIAILIYTACSPIGIIPPISVTEAPPNSTPTLVVPTTPTATETEIGPQMSSEVKGKFEKAGIDLENMSNATYEADGLHIVLESGEIVISNEELQKNIYNGQDNVLQYRDETNENVIYAFDKETGTFLEASKYIQLDEKKLEGYIVAESWEDLFAIWDKEKLFLTPFDLTKTYFPSADDIKRDYDNPNNPEYDKEFNASMPFGILPENMDSPFRPANYILFREYDESGKMIVLYAVSEQVFNPDDGSYSVIHFVRGYYPSAVKDIQEALSEDTFMLPRDLLLQERLDLESYKTIITYYKTNHLIDSNGNLEKIGSLIDKWFKERHVPKELENIPLDYRLQYFKQGILN